MKRYLLLIILCIVATGAMAQEEYTVVKVTGNVLKADSSKIIPGTKVTLKDKLIFSASEGLIILANPKLGRLVVKPEAKDKKGNSFIVLVSEYLDLHKDWKNKSAY
jgi:hypothetical protein